MKASKVQVAPTLLSTKGLAERLGLPNDQTITNWINRGVFPEALRPVWIEQGHDKDGELIVYPAWPISQFPDLKEWFEENSPRDRMRRPVSARHAAAKAGKESQDRSDEVVHPPRAGSRAPVPGHHGRPERSDGPGQGDV